jgi:aminoglycoside phosphotransferase (APT) family kinase protein
VTDSRSTICACCVRSATILHGDYRLGRLAFDPSWGDFDEPLVSVVDWRMATIGLPTRDLAFLLGTAMPVQDRRIHERDLVEHYHRALVAHGVADYSVEQCWDDYRYSALQGPFVTVLCGAMAPRSEFRDETSLLMISRSLDAVRDLASVDFN